jgi:hypothetical protein
VKESGIRMMKKIPVEIYCLHFQIRLPSHLREILGSLCHSIVQLQWNNPLQYRQTPTLMNTDSGYILYLINYCILVGLGSVYKRQTIRHVICK